MFESLSGQIKTNLGGRGAPGMFTIPGLLKMRVVKKPARKARKGINPFTGEETMFQGQAGFEGRQGRRIERPERHGLTQTGSMLKRTGALPRFFLRNSFLYFGTRRRLPGLPSEGARPAGIDTVAST